MSNYFTRLKDKNPTKYPARMGQPWAEEEVIQLLASIKKQKTIEDIATEHQRTIGSINAQRKKWQQNIIPMMAERLRKLGNLQGLQHNKSMML